MDSIFPPFCPKLVLSPRKLVILISTVYTVEFSSKHHFLVLWGVLNRGLLKKKMSQPVGLKLNQVKVAALHFQLAVKISSMSQSSEDRETDSLETGVTRAK